MALTTKFFESQKPRAKRYEVGDDLRPGLRMIVLPSGKKSWIYRFRDKAKGKQFGLVLGSFDSLGLSDARAAASERARQVAAGKNPVMLRDQERERMAKEKAAAIEADKDQFEKRWTEYVEKHIEKHLWPSTAKLVKKIFERYLKPEFAGDRIGEIYQVKINKLLARIERDNGPHAANKVYSVLRHFFAFFEGKEDGEGKERRVILAVSPMHGIAKPLKEEPRPRTFNDDELRWFWLACEADGERSRDPNYPQLKSAFGKMLQLILLNATRRDEVRCMVEKEFSLETGVWKIPAARTKNGVEHVIPMAPASVDILESLPRVKGKAGLVFTTNGETPISGLSKCKARIEKAMLEIAQAEAVKRGQDPDKIEIEEWRIHDLRRTARTRLSRIGVNSETAERCINHVKQSGVEAIYNQHEYFEEKKDAFARLAEHIKTIVDRKPAKVIPLRRGAR